MSEIPSSPVTIAVTSENPSSDLSLDVSLGGGGDQAAYPSLALDPVEAGFWGWVDRTTERVTSWLNPILVKEGRQSLKSKQFLITFFCLLAASCGWTILGVVFNAPDVYYLPSGDSMMIGYFLILSISMFALVPLVAFRSLAAELDEGTYEMLAITRLSAWRIVSGKMNSAILQMLIYFSAIVPCLAFCYLLRGISLTAIAVSISVVFLTGMVLTSFGLVLSTLAKGRTLQTFLLVGLVAAIVFVEFGVCAFVFEAVISGRSEGTTTAAFLMVAVGFSFVVLFLAAAAARVAPITENRSTRLRAILLIQQMIWIVTMSYFAYTEIDFEYVNYGMMWLGIFWLIVGMFMLGENPELSPRVQRGLPATFATRMLFSWWMPGAGTGFMFCVASGLAGLTVMAGVGTIGNQTIGAGQISGTPPIFFAFLMAGYLMGFLGMMRLCSLPLLKRVGPGFAVPLVVAIVLYFLGIVVPAIIDVAVQGRVPNNYNVLHASNWMWTLDKAYSSGGLPAEVSMLVLAVGGLVLAINLMGLFREFRRRRIAVPRRVKQDRETVDAALSRA